MCALRSEGLCGKCVSTLREVLAYRARRAHHRLGTALGVLRRRALRGAQGTALQPHATPHTRLHTLCAIPPPRAALRATPYAAPPRAHVFSVGRQALRPHSRLTDRQRSICHWVFRCSTRPEVGRYSALRTGVLTGYSQGTQRVLALTAYWIDRSQLLLLRGAGAVWPHARVQRSHACMLSLA